MDRRSDADGLSFSLYVAEPVKSTVDLNTSARWQPLLSVSPLCVSVFSYIFTPLSDCAVAPV